MKDKNKETWELAFEDYQKGMKYKEIAAKYEVSLNTVKSWKTRHWGNKGTHTSNKKGVHTNTRRTIKDKSPPIESLSDEEIETLCNDDLSDKQRLFCIYYSKTFNATKSYQKAYECSYRTAMVNGSKLLRKTRIKEEIMRLKKERCQREMLTVEDIFQKYIEIAFADITDFIEFRSKECLDTVVNEVVLKDSNEVDGTLVSEIKQGKDGVSVKLPNRMEALKWLTDHMNLATNEQKARIELLNAQKKKLEATDEEIEMEDDGFIAALNSSVADDWSDVIDVED